MTPFILHHPIVSLLAVVLIAAIVALFIGGALFIGTVLNRSDEPIAPPLIEPRELSDPENPSSWCQQEQAIKALPHESHGICKRHMAQMLEDSKRFSKSVHT